LRRGATRQAAQLSYLPLAALRICGCIHAVTRGVAGLGNVDVGNLIGARPCCHLLLMLFLTTER